ncbi:hypothetical protein RND81_09G042000 [Saponaria officinalis]|uniref:Reverse transcriptase domain-containing protein n=1 Tax=Saponaria officinalis TaxID=3572 RepID=A0AAW1IIC6_SAPOF
METQIAQLAQQVSDASKTQRQLMGKTKENPRGDVHVVTLRSGKELVDPVVLSKRKAVSVTDEVVEIVDETADEPEKDAEETAQKETVDIPTKPTRVYVPLVPFPQRLAKAKLEQKYGKFVDVLKNLHNNILFLDALSEIPSYGKFLKDLLSRARVSLMPLSIFKKLQMPELKPNRVSLQLADRSVKFPLDLCEDIPLSVGKLLIPCDFFVMDIPENAHVPIILGRPCLATARAMIDMKNDKLSLQVGEDKVEFELNKSMRAPSMHNACYRVDVLEDYLTGKSSELSSSDQLQDCLTNSDSDDVEMLAYDAWTLESSPLDGSPPK